MWMFHIKRWTSFAIPCIVYRSICPIYLCIIIFMIVIFLFDSSLSPLASSCGTNFNLCAQKYIYMNLLLSYARVWRAGLKWSHMVTFYLWFWSFGRYQAVSINKHFKSTLFDGVFFFLSIFFSLLFRTVYAKVEQKKIHVNIEKKSSSYFILSVVKNEARIKFYVHTKKSDLKRDKKKITKLTISISYVSLTLQLLLLLLFKFQRHRKIQSF